MQFFGLTLTVCGKGSSLKYQYGSGSCEDLDADSTPGYWLTRLGEKDVFYKNIEKNVGKKKNRKKYQGQRQEEYT